MHHPKNPPSLWFPCRTCVAVAVHAKHEYLFTACIALHIAHSTFGRHVPEVRIAKGWVPISPVSGDARTVTNTISTHIAWISNRGLQMTTLDKSGLAAWGCVLLCNNADMTWKTLFVRKHPPLYTYLCPHLAFCMITNKKGKVIIIHS